MSKICISLRSIIADFRQYNPPLMAVLGFKMPEFCDVYVISNKRSRELVSEFFDTFMPNAESSADEFEFPQYSNSPSNMFCSVTDAMDACFQHPNVDYRFYWRNKNGSKPEHAMLFFLEDGALIYGFSTNANDTDYINELFVKLKSFIDSELGLVTWEWAPDISSYEEFKKVVSENET